MRGMENSVKELTNLHDICGLHYCQQMPCCVKRFWLLRIVPESPKGLRSGPPMFRTINTDMYS